MGWGSVQGLGFSLGSSVGKGLGYPILEAPVLLLEVAKGQYIPSIMPGAPEQLGPTWGLPGSLTYRKTPTYQIPSTCPQYVSKYLKHITS